MRETNGDACKEPQDIHDGAQATWLSRQEIHPTAKWPQHQKSQLECLQTKGDEDDGDAKCYTSHEILDGSFQTTT